jgi:hypothetical protein
MGFSVFVEMINLRVRDKKVEPVNLRDAYKEQKLALQPVKVSVEKPVDAKARAAKAVPPKPAVKKASPKSKKK